MAWSPVASLPGAQVVEHLTLCRVDWCLESVPMAQAWPSVASLCMA